MALIGTYKELLNQSNAFARLLEDINQHKREQNHEQERTREQRSRTLSHQVSKLGSVHSETDEEEEGSTLPTNIEIKQEGIVKWQVYIAYIRAGIGVFLGLFLLIIMNSSQQATALMSNWWLAKWSDEETHRRLTENNCTRMKDGETSRIHAMGDDEWNLYRSRRFFTYCGQ